MRGPWYVFMQRNENGEVKIINKSKSANDNFYENRTNGNETLIKDVNGKKIFLS